MIKAKLCVLAVVVGLAGAVWAGQAGAAEKIGRWQSPGTVIEGKAKDGGQSIELSAPQVVYHQNVIVATDGRLSTVDRVLDASAKTITLNTKGPKGLGKTSLENGAQVSISLKDGTKIKATAKYGQIEWGEKVVRLEGDVVVTSSQPGEPAPATVKGERATISWAEKLGEGKSRVETESAAK